MAKFRQNDRLPPHEAKAYTEAGPVNLTTFASITFKMVGRATGTVVTGTATGDASGNLAYAWASGNLAVVDDYDAVYKATDGSGKVQTFPQGENLVVEVVAAI